MKKLTAILLAVVLVVTCLVAVACNPTTADDTVKVTLHFQDGKTADKTETYDENFVLPSPTRDNFIFVGWYLDEEGTVANKFVEGTAMDADFDLYAKWTLDPKHTHDFGDSYFVYVKCTFTGCSIYGRAQSLNTYADVFVYDFDDTKAAEIDTCYSDLLAYLQRDIASEYLAFEARYNDYEEYVDYIVEQYQYAYVFYCTYEGESYKTDYNFVSEYYNNMFANYYGLFKLIYETTNLSPLFFAEEDGWTEDDIQQALAWADAYGGGSENQNAADAIVDAYYDVLEAMAEAADEDEYAELQAQLFDLYTQFVTINNQIASDAGYDNYMYYAYDVIYGREYDPSQVATMQQYVKQYVGPIVSNVADKYENFAGLDNYSAAYFYWGLTLDTVFGTVLDDDFLDQWEATSGEIRNANKYMANYFKYLTSDTLGSKEINFFAAVEDLFKNGNYFVGSREEGAFTYYIPAQRMSILYFGGENYVTPFTFVHEFGHYYNGIYNGRLSLSMDHDETQSQGNEMLFLAWLANEIAGNKTLASGFEALEIVQMINTLGTVIMSTAVDEFEQAAYSGQYANGDALPTISATIDGQETTVIDYQTMYETILATYWEDAGEFFYTDYWSYVVFDNAGYYISYAMSALPSLELYAVARQDLDAARDSYLKLFTFSDNPELVDNNGNVADYQTILAWCGLKGPFQEELYQTLSHYFLSAD